MDKAYNHSQHEEEIYKKWEASGAFKPEVNPEGEAFTIIMPPPNANDPLHVGHAMFVSIEDILIRYHRMKGDAALWLPGTDHAGIETQYVFEKKLAKDGKSRFQFDRTTLYQMIWEYVQNNSYVAIDQMKKLGASADWSRYMFTLDEKVVDFVLDTFLKLHKDGLVYRTQRLVNYCTKCGTSYSELEVKYEERIDSLYYVKYPIIENEKGESLPNPPFSRVGNTEEDDFIVIATVRPEPIWADTHIAVHPENPKTKHLIGKKVKNPLTGAEMEIIADEYVDPEFGTGIVKLTPAHDPNDFELAKKYNLPIIQAIDMQGKITQAGGEYAGLKVEEARKLVVEKLKEKGLMEKIDEKYSHNVGTCYRCGRVLEPLPLEQFFIKVEGLSKAAIGALDSGETVVHGAGRDKILRNWLEGLKDWNISRQIVWGIRMPVWYKTKENPHLQIIFIDSEGNKQFGTLEELLGKSFTVEEIAGGLQSLQAPSEAKFVVSKESPGEGYLQETDTFDTWFSSGQWPVVTLKEGQAGDFERFYPTSVMETAYDILLFWVMRMMLLGIYMTGKSPFKHVYLHGLVRDEKGQKMSKSKGNVVNPLDLVEKYGADALRMALVMSTTPGQDSAVGESKVKGMRNFANKIWNAGRFVKLLKEEQSEISSHKSENQDEEFFKKLQTVVNDVTKQLDDLRIGMAAETVHNEFWHWFCDKCIEDGKTGKLSPEALEEGLAVFLRLLHPFMPYVTEAVWQELQFKELLITHKWPR